jgi:ABC-type transporter Mla subunit MlaD
MALQDLTPQLRTRLRRVEKMVGLFIGVAGLVLVGGFFYYVRHTAERRGWFVEKCPYFTYVQSGDGLKIGDPIVLMGFSVGDITGITAQPPGAWEKVFVTFDVKRPYYGYIWSDSKVKITATDFLGRRQLEVTGGVTGMPTVVESAKGRISEVLVGNKLIAFDRRKSKGVYIEPQEAPALTERAEKLVSQVEAALPNILSLTNQVYAAMTNANTLLVSANGLVTNATALVTEIRPAVTNLSARLDTTLTVANTNLVALAGNLDQTLINLASITGSLNSQVQTNDQILSQISRLVVDTDNMVQGLKKHWLLRGVFKKMNAETNAQPARVTTPILK